MPLYDFINVPSSVYVISQFREKSALGSLFAHFMIALLPMDICFESPLLISPLHSAVVNI